MPAQLPEHRTGSGREVDAVAGAVPPRLRASWLRSRRYGIPVDHVEPVFAGTERQESLFRQCGDEVLADLQQTLTAEPVGLMLTDADGLVLSRLSGDHTLLRALDDVHLAPGFGYSEREVGTNGLGLALADLAPTLVRAEQHYSHSLTGFTCAAAPVLDPATGRLQGAVNLTTWSRTSSDLLLTLARSAASTISLSMSSRSTGRRERPTVRRSLFRIEHGSTGTGVRLGAEWSRLEADAHSAMAAGSTVAVIGRPGSGRSSLVTHAARRAFPRHRILSAAAPAPDDVDTWLDLWTYEADRSDTVVVLRDVDTLPDFAAQSLVDLLRSADTRMPFAVTAERLHDIPAALASAVASVVSLPPLSDRPDDVVPLAHEFARAVRGRDVRITSAAERALQQHDWPQGAAELRDVVTRVASRADVVDVAMLPAALLAGRTRRLSSIEAFEHGEIVRVLASGKVTMSQAARQLGMSRATLYRKMAYYKIDPRNPG
ncbi:MULTISPECIES: helix-turn-helix domain-containing protein [Nocardiaceae]|uniref:Transcriptional regulator of acetoin/glycerol metabolism n=1 Tax=Rhodococcoides corynebacterioides TaxID=53972 RepID=A0ABS2KRG6_9NOCA|nr:MULTISPECIES: helix-turn-helix domain-containing protein [Rhodococcus]MBM7413851.1 transcriptional regulator of acetoin/glycerol metabolism [Rhodococcus corynebacterioides]MBP1116314.1 transcriptional regulator of acetoin/glycerol metabolism [Rhodococcus sp. PvP016]